MSFIQTRLSQLAFGTAKKRAVHKDAALKMIDATLNSKAARKEIRKAVGANANVDRSVVINDLHSSTLDSKPHFTVDLYAKLEPVGCAHVYSAGQYKIFQGGRKKARKAFRHGIKCPDLS